MDRAYPRGGSAPPSAVSCSSGGFFLGGSLLLVALALAAAGCGPLSSSSGRPALRPPPPIPRVAVRPVSPSPSDTLSAEEARDLAALQAETFQGPIGSSNRDLDGELQEFLSSESHALLAEKVDYDIPIVVNERVEYFIDYFQNRVHNSFAKWLARASQYVPYLRERFREAGLPEDLVYLSLIESGFSPQATSRASAVGYWQFMAGTARDYGLRVDRWVDERRDFEKSTEAAIAYLKDLHRTFGSWFLAAAAYNSGQAKIQKAIERYGSEDLWELSEFSYLREETKQFVPKLIAAILIAKEPERYGFTGVRELPPLETDHVTVPSQTDLTVIAAAAGTTVETIRSLNPLLHSFATPPGVRDFEVRIPRGSAGLFRERYARMPPAERIVIRTHLVRRGETPSRIASRYGVSTRALMAENGIRNARKLRVGQRLRLPRPAGGWELTAQPAQVAAALAAPEASRPAASSPPARPEARSQAAVGPAAEEAEKKEIAPARMEAAESDPRPMTRTTRYKVKRGDTLFRIARRHGVTVADMERWNPQATSRINPGMVLVVRPKPGAELPRQGKVAGEAVAPEETHGRSGDDRGPVVVKIRSGDTLWSIARRHGVTLEQLKEWNGLRGAAIRAGQRLVLFPEAPRGRDD